MAQVKWTIQCARPKKNRRWHKSIICPSFFFAVYLDSKNGLRSFADGSVWFMILMVLDSEKHQCNANYQIQPCRSQDQTMRSKRLFHLLQQNFLGYSKMKNLVRTRITSTGITESNGFELWGWSEKSSLWCPVRKRWATVSSVWSFECVVEWNIFQTLCERCNLRLSLFIPCWMLQSLWVSLEMYGLVKEISFCCIWQICLQKSRNFFFNCVRMPLLWIGSRSEFKTITYAQEFKEILELCMLHNLCRRQLTWRTKRASIVEERSFSWKLTGTQDVQSLWQEGSCGERLLEEASRPETQTETKSPVIIFQRKEW